MFRNCWKMDTLFCDLKEMVRFGAFELRECEMVTWWYDGGTEEMPLSGVVVVDGRLMVIEDGVVVMFQVGRRSCYR
ncbi:hypothetical protein Hanom_Chr16g01512751 [Helianthus anomalus]